MMKKKKISTYYIKKYILLTRSVHCFQRISLEKYCKFQCDEVLSNKSYCIIIVKKFFLYINILEILLLLLITQNKCSKNDTYHSELIKVSRTMES